MLPIAYYLLKVIICSGILYGYYWLLLRNKVFHKYNRFYLMTAVVLSLLLPLIKINFLQQNTEEAGIVKIFRIVSNGDEYMDNIIVTSQSNFLNTEQLYSIAYLVVSLIFLVVFLHTLYSIFNLLKKYPTQIIDKISFINTDAKSTPFSFLNYIFWNHNIDMESTTGKQIFKHELAHVQEKHSYDKLFINIVLIFFWCNPFYWLYRKELNMIHEFIADKKAVEDCDTAVFAAMVLQATYPQHRFQLTNNFFYSPIKRRLLMLTKNRNSKVNYIGRIMVLPLLVLIFAAFTIKVKNSSEVKKIQHSNAVAVENILAAQLEKNQQYTDTVPFGVYINARHADTNYLKTNEYRTKALVIVDGIETGNVGMDYVEKSKVNYSSIVIYNPAEAKKVFGEKGKYGVIKLTNKDAVFVTADSVFVNEKFNSVRLSGNKTQVKGDLSTTVIYVDGKLCTPAALNAIPAAKISSVNILKGDKLDDITDTKGKKAVINVQLKPDNLQEVVVTGYKKPGPLCVVDGEIKAENFDLNSISPNDIEKVNVLKDKPASDKYGDKGKNGVVEITMKVQNSKLHELVVEPKKPSPLYVINNKIEADDSKLKSMNPNDIERIDVLKDTAAFNKYGEKGKYGVVEILTKKNISLNLEKSKLPDEKTQNDTLKVFTKTETEPAYPGGFEAWKAYLIKNLNAAIPVDEGWKAGTYTIVVRFIVHIDGSVSDVIAMDHEGSKTAAHCIDLVRKSIKWIPAVQNGKAVNAYRKQPITFVVQTEKKSITANF